jgi:hypothetical protein
MAISSLALQLHLDSALTLVEGSYCLQGPYLACFNTKRQNICGLGSCLISTKHGSVGAIPAKTVGHASCHSLFNLRPIQHPECEISIDRNGTCAFVLFYNLELMRLLAVISEMKPKGWSDEIVDHNMQKLRHEEVGPFSKPDKDSNLL